MTKEIKITHEESENVERLFAKYNSYMSMLEFFTNTTNTAMYDRKWEEASQIWIELNKAKRAIEEKYKPQGDWDSFEFNFDNHSVVFQNGA